MLSRDRPFVVLDAPQGSKLRARLETTLQDTQVVWFQNTATPNVNDRLRGARNVFIRIMTQQRHLTGMRGNVIGVKGKTVL